MLIWFDDFFALDELKKVLTRKCDCKGPEYMKAMVSISQKCEDGASVAQKTFRELKSLQKTSMRILRAV